MNISKGQTFLITFLFPFFNAFSQIDDGRLISIPVVFHILYGDSAADNGINRNTFEKGNSTMYLPKEKIMAELNDLDRDFRNINSDTSAILSDFKKIMGNTNISFYLEEIKYLKVNKKDILKPFSNSQKLHELSPPTDTKSTLNIYISLIKYKGSGTNGLTPVKTRASSTDNDVVNLNYKWVGLGYRLLTHEVGHWFGLWHTWDKRQESDGIKDIPLQESHTNMSCDKCPPTVKEQFTPNNQFKHSNYNNFMDYSGCRIMFSRNQASKMRNVIVDYRPEIWKNSTNK